MLLLFITVILFFRAPYEFISPQLWGEDGPIFLSQARSEGFASLTTPYVGYLHTMPRMLALVTNLFPLEYVPRIYFVFSFLAVLLVCFYLSTISWLPPRLKIAFPLAIVLAPHYGEVFFTLTNIHWLTSILIPMIAIGIPIRSTPHLIRTVCLLFLIGLSDPFILFFYPLFLIRLIAQRGSGHEHKILCLAATTCACLQMAVFLSSPQGTTKVLDTHFWHWAEALLLRPVAGFFLGKDIAMLGYTSTPVFIILSIVLAVFLCVTLYAIMTTELCNRRITLLLFYVAATALCVSFARAYDKPLALAPFYGADRYFYIPYVFMCFAFLWFSHTAKGIRNQVGIAVCVLTLLSSASVFHFPRKTDFHWQEHIKQLHNQDHVRIPINPEGWFVDLYRSR